jgi:hypothetical protein
LIVSSAAAGGEEAARATCEDVRRRVLEGEDFGLLVEEHGVELRETLGLTPFRPAQAFRDRNIAAFSETAAVGELSAVLPLMDPRTGEPAPRLGFQLAELHDRKQADFADPDVQRLLREALTRNRGAAAIGRARERLWRESYLWVNPLVAGPAPSSAPAPGP